MASANDDDEDVWQDGSMRLSRANSATNGSSGYLTATDGSASDSSSHKVGRRGGGGGGGGEASTLSTTANSRLTKPGEASTPSTTANSRLTKPGEASTPSTTANSTLTKPGEVSTPSTTANSTLTKPGDVSTPPPSASRRTKSGEVLTPSTSAASRRTKSGDAVTPSTSPAWRHTKSGVVLIPSTSGSRRTKPGEVSTPSTLASRRTKSGDASTPSTLASRRTKPDTQRVIPTLLYASKRIQRLAKLRSEFVGSELEFEIEASKDHWSELSPELLNGALAGQQDLKKAQQQQNRSGSVDNGRVDGKIAKPRSCGRVVKEFCGYLRIVSRKKNDGDPTSNRAVFETLRKNPQWAKFLEPFSSDGSVSASARKMAEGAQSEIYDSSRFTVHKVFKSPHSLRDLHEQWPHGMLLKGKQIYSMAHALGLDIPVSISEMMPSMSSGTYFHELNTAGSFGGVLLEDGRFALVMKKYDGDLRTLIDARMLQNGNQGPPFGYEMSKWMMRQIAVGMNGLHRDRIVHRDLKASNVLYEVSGVGGIDLVVADFECSARVLGTGFWRAPEILKALPDVPAHAFSEKSDVYSYAMTCYEILTGCLPFENQLTSEVGVVVREGQRPELPAYVEPSVRDLIGSCWQENPAKRPSFGVILKTWREICV